MSAAPRTDVGTVEDLKASAVKTVGLDDFGTDDDNYIEALSVLLDSYRRDAGFTELGSKMSRFFLRNALVIERMAAATRQSAQANQSISQVTQVQVERMNALRDELAPLFSLILESSARSAITATISDDLTQVAQDFNTPLGRFTLDLNVTHPKAKGEKRAAPRIPHGLVVNLLPEGGAPRKGITGDFSMTGASLRMPAAGGLRAGDQVGLDIFTPSRSQAEYEAQVPLRVRAEIIRVTAADGADHCGVAFRDLAPAQRQRLEACFAYFARSPRFDGD